MFWKENVRVSDEVFEIFEPGLFILRLLGLCPVQIYRKGNQLYMKRSPFYVVYSLVLGFALPIFTYKGVFTDIKTEKSKSIKIKSQTDMYVAFSDITVLELVVVTAVLINTFEFSYFFKYMKCLNEVDRIIPPQDIKATRRASIIVIVVILLITCGICIADYSVYFRIIAENIEKTFILECYWSFYATYFVLLMSQYQFWHMGQSILRRLTRLNGKLQFEDDSGDSLEKGNKEKTNNPPNLAVENKRLALIIDTLNVNQKTLKVLPKSDSIKPKPNDHIYNLMTVYGTLCDAVEFVNDFYGLSNAATIIGILWHLIETPYLLILEITGNRNDMVYISVMTSWCLIHIARLMLIAQPCYACLMQVQKTKALVCKVLFSEHIDNHMKLQLQNFSTVLMHRKLEFSASGLATINRSLLTSVLGAITTYLVIVLQFARSEQIKN